MTILMALAPGERGSTAVSLTGLLTRSTGDDIVVCTVMTSPWPRSMDRTDDEYAGHLDREGQAVLDQAREDLPDGVEIRFLLHHARSVASGLLDIAERTGARLLVFGSSSRGAYGRIELGSVPDRLMHSSPIATAIAPRGFTCPPDAVASRVSAAYGGSDSLDDAHWAARLAVEMGAALRLTSFAVRPRTMITAGVGSRAESAVVEEWRRSIDAEQERAAAELSAVPHLTPPVQTAVGRGHSWSEALDDVPWTTGDILVVGSSSLAPLSRVFLGSRAAKIVRHSPMPVIAVPRAQTTEASEVTDT